MKQIFFDKEKSVVIKVFSSFKVMEREACGVQNFSSLVVVPKVEKIGPKVLKISLLEGFLGYQIPEEDLSLIIAQFLLRKKPLENPSFFTITEEIKKLQAVFQDQPEILNQLGDIQKLIKNKKLFPVHGDLHKQNIIIKDGNLSLIDFEHFIFSPKELEVCNSLFFNDGNCLDILGICQNIPEGFFDKKIMMAMLNFFAIKQIGFGMSKLEAEKRLKLAQDKITRLTFAGKKLNLAKREGNNYYFL